jgi:colanic acid/amylovoran biosynthesis glycosyltransferase
MSFGDVLVVYVAHEYPARSQTFVVSEATALREAGYEVLLYPMQRPWEGPTEDWVISWTKAITPSVLPFLVVSAAHAAMRAGEMLRQLRLPPRTIRQRLKFLKALTLACALGAIIRTHAPGKSVHLHAHFFGLMSEVALLARLMLPAGTTVSIMGHAADVTRPSSCVRLVHESESADLVTCASGFIEQALRRSGSTASTKVVRCGVPRREGSTAPPRSPDMPLRAVSVARLVEKKGVDDCLRACRALVDVGDVDPVLRVVGDGPEWASLLELRRLLRLERYVHMLGTQPPDMVLRILGAQCDVFVLPCKIARNGDSDGIPVALMEAMSLGIPVVTTRVSGIPELVADGETGFLVPPGNVSALADCLRRVAKNPARARAVGLSGQEHVRQKFSREAEASALGEGIRLVRRAAPR